MEPMVGVLMLIHPDTGDVHVIRRHDENKMETFRHLVLDGYNPVGPNGQALAARLRESAGEENGPRPDACWHFIRTSGLS